MKHNKLKMGKTEDQGLSKFEYVEIFLLTIFCLVGICFFVSFSIAIIKAMME